MMAIGVFAALIWFPQTEGRAVNLSLFEIYRDPLIVYVYIGSVPFFVGLYQAVKLLNLIDANKAFSKGALEKLRNIKLASLSLIGAIVPALAYIRFFVKGDDPAGPIGLGIVVCLVVTVIATVAGVFERLLQNAVDIKTENDLTV